MAKFFVGLLVFLGMFFMMLFGAQADAAEAMFGGLKDSRALASAGESRAALEDKSSGGDWEFRTAPLALLARWYTFHVSYRLDDNWSLGPSLIIYDAAATGNMFLPSYKGGAGGLNLSYSFNSARESGAYLGTNFLFERYTSYPHAIQEKYERQGFRTNAVLGYRKTLLGSASMLAGAGLENRTYATSIIEKASAGENETRRASNDNHWLPYVEFNLAFEL